MPNNTVERCNVEERDFFLCFFFICCKTLTLHSDSESLTFEALTERVKSGVIWHLMKYKLKSRGCIYNVKYNFNTQPKA